MGLSMSWGCPKLKLGSWYPRGGRVTVPGNVLGTEIHTHKARSFCCLQGEALLV